MPPVRKNNRGRSSSSSGHRHTTDDGDPPAYIKDILNRLETVTSALAEITKTNNNMADNLGKVVERIASLEIQVADIRKDNSTLNDKLETLEKRIAELEKRPAPVNQPRSYAGVLENGLPPRPHTNGAGGKIIGKNQKGAKPLQALYPKASREVMITFENSDQLTPDQSTADIALEAVNDALEKSTIKKRLFHGARFSIARNMVLTTGLHDTNSDLVDYLDLIETTLSFIGPAKATATTPWSKFLLHGVPTHLQLETIRRDVEAYCNGHKLGQTPRWLAKEENRRDKEASTIVLAFLGAVTLTDLGGKSIRVGNRTCNLSRYIQFGPQTQCLHCQGFGHPKEFCTAGPICAVCAENHETAKHQCPQNVCKGGYMCTHGNMKCTNCQAPHRASNRNCPERVKRSQEFKELLRLRVEERMTF